MNLDPANTFAQERVRGFPGRISAKDHRAAERCRGVTGAPVAPNLNRASFHFRGDTRDLLTTIANSYG